MTAFYGILLPFLGTVMGAGMRILFEKITWNASAAGIDRLCRRGYGGGLYLEFADSSYGTGGGYGQRCGDSCRSRFLAWHPVPADFG